MVTPVNTAYIVCLDARFLEDTSARNYRYKYLQALAGRYRPARPSQQAQEQTCSGALKDVLVGPGKARDISRGAPHVEANHLQFGRLLALPLGGQRVAHIPDGRQSCYYEETFSQP